MSEGRVDWSIIPQPDAPAVELPGESVHARGKLKLFLGYAPGTGKTLAMLEDAYRRVLAGVDVVAGYVDVQGEILAMQLLEKFETFPHRVISSSGMTFDGMDLDAILERHPKLVLVDHLSHTNPPGLRHQNRYLEVEELLSAGIDVYTTLNVYQIESQTDAVSYLTGVTIHEVVPDQLVDEADQIEMVDLPPQELMERYRGKRVAVPAKAELIMEKFFQPSSLFALRELAMRYVALRSNELMHTYLADRGLADTEPASQRLLVCIGPGLSGGRLVRAGRRMADETRAEWTVVYVETPENLERSEEPQSKVAQHLRLAELLGARTETLTGRTVAEAVRDYTRKHHIHKVVVGRSAQRNWYDPFGRTLAEQLLRLDPTVNVYAVGEEDEPQRLRIPRFLLKAAPLNILVSLVLVALPTVVGLLLSPYVISRSANIIMLYLLSVVIASMFLGIFPAILTALLSVIVFKYFFVPPLYQFFNFAPEYTITFLSLLITSIVLSTLVSRERAVTRAAHRRAEQVTQLYELSRDLANDGDLPDILKTIVEHIHETFEREALVLLAEKGKLVLSAASSDLTLDPSELTAAEWAFQQGRPAGAGTGTFSYAGFRYFPMITSRGTVGVVGVCFSELTDDLHPEQTRLLSAFVTKAASSVERGLYAEEASQAEVLRATEKLQTALLNSVSHDLRTPLASITGVLSSLRLEDDFIDQETRRDLVETAYDEAERLNRLVGNLLDMSRLEFGNLRVSVLPCDIQDVVGSALNTLSTRLEGYPVTVNIQPDLPLVPMDFVLINQVMINLLDNAAKYSGENGPLEISARTHADQVEVEVADRGPGIPEEDLGLIFEKFYRVKRFEHVVGTGLGLSICKGIVEVHNGRIWAENREGGGVRMIFTLPLAKPEENLHEPAVLKLNKDE